MNDKFSTVITHNLPAASDASTKPDWPSTPCSKQRIPQIITRNKVGNIAFDYQMKSSVQFENCPLAIPHNLLFNLVHHGSLFQREDTLG